MYEKAVAQDHVDAKTSLGSMLYEGDGVNKDRERGLRLLKEAAARGGEDAQCFLKDAATVHW